MKTFLLLLCLLPLLGYAEKTYHRPAVIQAEELEGFSKLSESRKKLILRSLTVARENRALKYKFGGATPKDGGFDCSGAIHHILRGVRLEPPRTSAQQYLWVRDAENFIEISPKIRKTGHPVFSKLTPGDLLFWSGTYLPTDSRSVKITHVGMYLGREKKDGHPVMICATKGRSYRGRSGDGLGVYDFKLPSAKSQAKFVGYGRPPGLLTNATQQATKLTTVEALNRLNQKLTNAYEREDVPLLRKLLSDKHVHNNVFGTRLTKEQFLKDIESGILVFESYTTPSIEWTITPDMAVATGLIEAVAKRNGRIVPAKKFRFTRIFVREKDEWRVLLFQNTMAPQR